MYINTIKTKFRDALSDHSLHDSDLSRDHLQSKDQFTDTKYASKLSLQAYLQLILWTGVTKNCTYPQLMVCQVPFRS